MMKRTCLIAPAALLIAVTAEAREKVEILAQTLPPGFVAAVSRSQPGMEIAQYLPAGQTLKDWSKMITTQIFRSSGPPPPPKYLGILTDQWLSACPGAKPAPVTSGMAEGRATAMLELDCPKLAATNKPEHTIFRVIQGASGLFVGQYTFRVEPTEADRHAAVDYLASLHLEGTASPH